MFARSIVLLFSSIAAAATLLPVATQVRPDDAFLTPVVLSGCDVDIKPFPRKPLLPVSYGELLGGKVGAFFYFDPPMPDGAEMGDWDATAISLRKLKVRPVGAMTPSNKITFEWNVGLTPPTLGLKIENGVDPVYTVPNYRYSGSYDPLAYIDPPVMKIIRRNSADPKKTRVRIFVEVFGFRTACTLGDA